MAEEEPPAENPPADEEASKEEPPAEEEIKISSQDKLSDQLKKSKGSAKSLSTIPEEPSLKTEHEFSNSSSSATEPSMEEPEKVKKVPLPPPKLPEPIPSREKRHTSALLKATSRETVLPHDRPRTMSMQERLLSHIQFTGRPLFHTVVGAAPAKTASILITGFGLRNLSSLQEALHIEEQNKLKQLYKAQERQDDSSSSMLTATDSSSSLQISRQRTESSSETQTDGSYRWECGHRRKLAYLMGLHGTIDEEGGGSKTEVPEVPEQEGTEAMGVTESVKQAQKYLRVHKIFEFFQFVIAHLLSALPENPIAFIIELLDKCLIYRAGLTEPPLLYNRKHLECLFYLMDKMRTGYIELEQYKTGLRTVGVCNFNEKPLLTSDGMVTKEDFIEEAHDCLSHLLTDMIKRRWLKAPPPITPPPPPTPQISSATPSSAGEFNSYRFTKTRLFLD